MASRATPSSNGFTSNPRFVLSSPRNSIIAPSTTSISPNGDKAATAIGSSARMPSASLATSKTTKPSQIRPSPALSPPNSLNWLPSTMPQPPKTLSSPKITPLADGTASANCPLIFRVSAVATSKPNASTSNANGSPLSNPTPPKQNEKNSRSGSN